MSIHAVSGVLRRFCWLRRLVMWLWGQNRSQSVSGGAGNVHYGKLPQILAYNANCIVC